MHKPAFHLNLNIDKLEVEEVQETPQAAGRRTGKKKQTPATGSVTTKYHSENRDISKASMTNEAIL